MMRWGVVTLVGLTAFASPLALAQSMLSADFRYDSDRQLVGVISPDPDGPGGNPRPAVRNTYDAGGQLVRIETGSLANWQPPETLPQFWSGFTVYTITEITYDSHGRKTSDAIRPSGGAISQFTQYSYDVMGQLECTAVRMNPASFGSLATSACALTTTGSQGPDRITRNVYDAAGQLLTVRRAYGTSLQQDYATYEYTPNGKRKAVIDSNGNRAEMTYDGLDRQKRWVFPSKLVAGNTDATDYEEYGYDPDGNRTSLRKRDGRTIAYDYDALNRIKSKTYPNGGARAVYYDYDLRGLQTAARFDGPSGADAVLSAWDGFGRQSSSTTSMNGVSRTLSYQHDANGNRTRITWPDSQYVRASWDGLDRFYFSDTAAGAHLNFVSYDTAGRVGIFYRWGGTSWASSTSYGYDGISRLASVSDAFQNSIADVATAFGYNPASQIVTRTRNNDDYRFTGYVNVDRSYALNGLNQYTSAGGATFTYDVNGNLTTDGTTGYGYDVENRLVSATTGAALTYDPLGRLWQTYSAATGTTQFLYDGDALVAEYDGLGNMLKRYIHGAADGQDDPLVEYVGSGVTSPRYLFADHQGSIIAIADANGNRVAVNGYDEYGIPNGYAGSGTPNTGRFQFTGQAWVPELGMYHYKARVYSPTLGRFLQTDPVGYDDQVNLYAYVGNDPVNLTDPNGQCPWCLGGLIGAGEELATQMLFEGKSLDEVDWVDVGVGAAVGASGVGLLKTATRLAAADLRAIRAGKAIQRARAVRRGTPRAQRAAQQARRTSEAAWRARSAFNKSAVTFVAVEGTGRIVKKATPPPPPKPKPRRGTVEIVPGDDTIGKIATGSTGPRNVQTDCAYVPNHLVCR